MNPFIEYVSHIRPCDCGPEVTPFSDFGSTHSLTLPPEYRDYPTRRENLKKLLVSYKKRTEPELVNNIRALEQAMPELLRTPPRWIGTGGDGQLFWSECELEVFHLLKSNSERPFITIGV